MSRTAIARRARRFGRLGRAAARAVRSLWSGVDLAKDSAAEPASCERLEGRLLLKSIDNFGWHLWTCGWHYFNETHFSYPVLPTISYKWDAFSRMASTARSADGNPDSGAVNYFDGRVQLETTDLSSDGFGKTWGQTRSWCPDMQGPGTLGNHWFVNDLPQLLHEGEGYDNADENRPSWASDTMIVVASGADQLWFDYDPDTSTWKERHNGPETLTVDTSSYILTDSTGAQTYFHDFNTTDHKQDGQFIKFYDPYRDVTQVISTDSSGAVTEVQRSNGDIVESWLYTYSSVGAESLITNVKLRRSTNGGTDWTVVRQVTYSYYGSSETGGNQYDLKSAQIKDGSGNALDTYYYRYWKSGDTVDGVTQPTGALKFVFSPGAYARMAAAVSNPDTASDTNLAPYADAYYVYDSNGSVYQKTTAQAGGGSSGQGTSSFFYDAGFSKAMNSWSSKTVEVLPDSNTNTVYANYLGEPMLEVFTDITSGAQWGTFYKYDADGRLILKATPSALNLPNYLPTLESYSDLLHDISGNYEYLSDDIGLIYTAEYGSTTTATTSTAGDVAGYYKDTKIQKGENGTAIPQQARAYIKHTANSIDIYLLASDEVYSDTGGANAQTTTYDYTWYSGKNQPDAKTVTHPTISSSQNGPGTTDSEIYTYDQYNRVTQFEDGDGYLTTYAYDMDTGGITQQVVDSATLALTTDIIVDDLGRPTQITDPNGNVTYIHYNDTSYEKRVYPGWHQIGSTGNYTTIGPVQVTREYRPAAGAAPGYRTLYYETLTFTPPVESTSTPSGIETIDKGNISSLSRTLTNDAGQIDEIDQYYYLGNLAYSTSTPQLDSAVSSNDSSSGNYHATYYGYDDRGRLDHLQEPTGTIVDTVYDGLGRETSISMGTDDGGSSNMLEVATGYYDQRQPAPTGVQTTQVSGGSLSGSTYYVRVTLVSASGESLASTATTQLVDDNYLLNVSIPTAVTGAIGFNVYVGYASGYEVQQNSSPVSFGSTGWTEPTGGISFYGSLPPVDQVGNGNLTQVTLHPATGSTNDRVTQYLYDWRDRLIAEKDGVQGTESTTLNRPLYYYELDNLDEVTASYQYDGDGVSLLDFSNGLPTADASKLRAKTAYSYGKQQRLYRTQVYQVNQSSGAISSTNILATNLFYNYRDLVIAESNPGGLVYKHSYDGAGRSTKDTTSDGGVLNGATQDWTTANSTSNDIVLEQVLNSFDSNGNLIETIRRQRFDNDPTGSSGKGDLSGPSGGNKASRDYYTDFYYDAANRLTHQANVGNNGGTSWTRTSTPSTRADTYLLTDYCYNADAIQTVTINGSPTGGTFTLTFDGQTTGSIAYNAPANGTSSVQVALGALSNIGSGNVTVTGPNGGPYTVRFSGMLGEAPQPVMTSTWSFTGGSSPSVSVVTTTIGGDAGRVQRITDPRGLLAKNDFDLLGRTIRTISGFTDGVPSSSTNQTTAYTFDGNGQVLTMTAVMPSGTNSQTTGYEYSIGSTGNLYSHDLLSKIKFPDKSTGQASNSSSDQQSFGYDFLGQTVSFTDRNGTTHSYEYDVVGRITADIASSLGSGVDGAVRRLVFSYDTGGRPYQQTSYSATSGGSVVNQMTESYNGFGQLTSLAHSIGTSGTVYYAYTETSGGTVNNSRLTSITYPNGRQIDYAYTDSLNSKISRVDGIKDHSSGTVLEGYTYLGLETIVTRSHSETGINLTYVQVSGDTLAGSDGGDRYTGLDRFGRVVDQYWVNPSTPSSPTDRFQYGYDRDSNTLYKKNLVSSANSELYHANGSSNGYDGLNRLTNFRRGVLSDANSDGIPDTVSSASTTNNWSLDALGNWTGTGSGSRTFNSQNQITSMPSGSTTPTYDNNGNTTTDETGKTYVYDAWNRMVQANAGGTVTSFKYEALGQRASEALCTGTTTYSFFSAGWQDLEDDVAGGSSTTKRTYVWGLGYIDDLVERDETAGSGSATRLYVQQDAGFNVTALVSTAGAVVERFVYDPYGAATVLTSSWTTTTDSYNWAFRWKGGRYDTATGLYNFRFRDYSPTLGRWMQNDPAGYVDGANLYQAMLGQPINTVDPMGLDGEPTTQPGNPTTQPSSSVGASSSVGDRHKGWTGEWPPQHDDAPLGEGNYYPEHSYLQFKRKEYEFWMPLEDIRRGAIREADRLKKLEEEKKKKQEEEAEEEQQMAQNETPESRLEQALGELYDFGEDQGLSPEAALDNAIAEFNRIYETTGGGRIEWVPVDPKPRQLPQWKPVYRDANGVVHDLDYIPWLPRKIPFLPSTRTIPSGSSR